jgi:hypothetical protein
MAVSACSGSVTTSSGDSGTAYDGAALGGDDGPSVPYEGGPVGVSPYEGGPLGVIVTGVQPYEGGPSGAMDAGVGFDTGSGGVVAYEGGPVGVGIYDGGPVGVIIHLDASIETGGPLIAPELPA